MKGNKQIFSNIKVDRIKGYKKLFKKNEDHYKPPKYLIKDILEAMEAQGFDSSKKEVEAYMKASYAVFDRNFYKNERR